MLDIDVGHEVRVLGVDEQDGRARVLDDVAHLVAVQPEVDRHQHAAERRDAVQRDEEARRVRRHDRHPVAGREAELVERDREAAGLRAPGPRR